MTNEELLLSLTYEVEPLSKNCDIYTLKEFGSLVKSRFFIDSDGFGEFATENLLILGPIVKPSTFSKMTVPAGVTHIVWYNK